MQFWALFKKTFRYFIRNKIGTCCEIISPIILIILIIILRNLIDVLDLEETSYPTFSIPSTIDQILSSPIKDTILNTFLKDCSDENRQGGRVAFSPRNPITEDISRLFTARNDEVVFFSSEQEINEYVTLPDYTLKFTNGTRRQLCLAVSFQEYDVQNSRFSYSLKFNLSNPSRVEHIDAREYKEYKIPFKVNDIEELGTLITKGTASLQLLIDQLLLKKAFPGIDLNVGIRAMKSPAYKEADFTPLPLELFFVLISLIVFLRIISMVVTEREKRIIENMENMGMKKVNYLGSAMCFHFLLYFIISLYMAPLLKLAFLRETNLMLIFLVFWIYTFSFIALGYFVSCFFVKSKNAIIAGLIIFVILYFISFLWEPLWERGEGITTFIALSPIGGISQVSRNLLQTESSFYSFGFGDLSQLIYNFRIRTYIIIGILEIFIFVVFSFYCFFVIPLSIGVAEHPLFFLGYSKQKSSSKKHDLEQENDEEKASLKSENFEEVEQEFIQQRTSKKTILIEALSKRFSNGKLAVNNLNLEIYEDQIFALLGQNGAGKTTTISMISGLLDKTSGSITIMGYDSQSQRAAVKKLIGVCPQVNPIFDFLTVQEHLELYAKVKGVLSKQTKSEIKEILSDIDLLHKKNYKAKLLSGGQKRKLCVAMAFIGGSKIILLDEPTSGMDTYARRLLWEMIKKYKQNRLIILTTHLMDEADYLGDRIGIMSDGKLMVCGSSLFLKKQFGTGYELTIVKTPGMSKEKIDSLIQKIKEISKNSKFVSEVGTELKIQLPEEDSPNFQELFRYLENNQSELKYESFGIGLTTLEEVFLKISTEKEKKEFEQQLKKTKSLQNGNSQFLNIENSEIDKKNLKDLKYKNRSQIFASQMQALLKKRIIYFIRDKLSLLCQILIPLLSIIVALSLTKIQFVNVPEKTAITKDLYPDQIILNKVPPNYDQLTSLYPDTKLQLSANTQNQFNQKLFENPSDKNNYGIYFDKITSSQLYYTGFFNTTAPAGAYLSANIAHNTLLQSQKGNEAYIKMFLSPFSVTQGVKNLESTFDSIFIAFYFGLAFAFIPSSMIVFLIKEREFNAKHQQLISGMSVFAYWLSNFIVDYLIYLIIGLLSYALIFIFGVDSLTKDSRWVMTLMLFIFYGIGFIPFVYFLSFWFKKPSAGQVTLFIIAFFFGMFLVFLGFALRVIDSTRSLSKNFLEFIFRLVPFFSFNFGILNLGNLELYKLIFEYSEVPSPFEPNGVLFDFLFLPLMGIIYFGLVFLMEISYKFKKTKTLFNNDIQEELNNENASEPKEPDVIAEEQMIEENNLDRDRVYVKKVVKVYPITSSRLCGKKKNIDYKLAVKQVSFGVQHSQVFCLLGTNGAGKTSVFKMLTGDTFPDSGEVYVQGYQMPEQFDKVRELIGYCPQFDTLFENLTCQEHLELYCDLKGVDKRYKKQLVANIINKMNLQQYRKVQAGTYSGGNKRKLSVAIALIGKPPIVFLDEPSSGMDPYARRFMWSVINDISVKRKDSSIVLTTHSMEEAEALSTKLAIMVEGRIKTIGSIQQLKNKYGDCFEVEVKFKVLKNKDLREEITKVKQSQNLNGNLVNLQQIEKILTDLYDRDLYQEINENKKGKNLKASMDKNEGKLSLEILIEWIMIQEKVRKLERVLQQKFGAELLETFQTFARFKIRAGIKLSEIFGFFEQNLQAYNLSDYNIKQISLEQIFIKFASDVNHDDQSNQLKKNYQKKIDQIKKESQLIITPE